MSQKFKKEKSFRFRNKSRAYFYENFLATLIEALSGDKTGEVVLKPTRYIRVMSIIQPVLEEYRERIEHVDGISGIIMLRPTK